MNRKPDISEWYNAQRAVDAEVAWLCDDNHRKFYREVLGPFLGEHMVHSVLEVGCGSGILAAELPRGVRYTGLDANEWFISRAGRRCGPNCEFLVGDVRSVPDWGEPFDLSMCFDFLKHFSPVEWPSVLSRVLAWGALSAFNVQEAEAGFDDGVEFHHTFVTAGEVLAVVSEAGHRVLDRLAGPAFATGAGTEASDVVYFTGRCLTGVSAVVA